MVSLAPAPSPSTIARKLLVATTGLLLAGWTGLHMVGNLLVFAGGDTINRYGAALQGSPLIWVMRTALVVLVGVHVVHALVLWRRSARARSRPRGPRRPSRATRSSRTMRAGGLAIAAFTIYHVLHIFGVGHADYVSGDVHHNVVNGLAPLPVAAVYLVATGAFCAHLHHGLASAARTLGLSRGYARTTDRLGRRLAALVFAGFAAPCVAAVAGWIPG